MTRRINFAALNFWDYLNTALVVAVIAIVIVVGMKLMATIETDKDREALQESRAVVAKDALTANNDLIKELTKTKSAPQIDPHTASSDELNTRSLHGQNFQWFGFWTDFMAHYNDAVSLRLTSEDYAQIEARYRTAQHILGSDPSLKEWSSRVHEGLAYAEMKQGNLSGADRDAEAARKMDRNSAFAGSTVIKIRCLERRAPSEIQGELQRLNSRLATHIAETGNVLRASGLDIDKLELRNAKLEFDYLHQDAELYRICAYAGIRPPS